MSSGHQALLLQLDGLPGASLPGSTKLCYDQLTIVPSRNRGFILSFVWMTGGGCFLFVKWEYV